MRTFGRREFKNEVSYGSFVVASSSVHCFAVALRQGVRDETSERERQRSHYGVYTNNNERAKRAVILVAKTALSP